jgi:hypothetical protein
LATAIQYASVTGQSIENEVSCEGEMGEATGFAFNTLLPSSTRSGCVDKIKGRPSMLWCQS